METRWMRLLALLAALVMLAAACGSDDDETTTDETGDDTAEDGGDADVATDDADDGDSDDDAIEDDDAGDDAAGDDGDEPDADCATDEVLCIGLVTDVGEVEDKGFNQSAWEGVQQLQDDLGAEVEFIQTEDSTDFEANVGSFIDRGYDVIVTVGFALGAATGIAADANPDVYFVGVDQFQGAERANVAGLIFPEDQAGFLAGALAGLMTESGVVGQVLGTDLVPPVVAYKEGFEGGVAYTNPDADVISTYHPGGIDVAFTDPEWGASTAREALDNGADVVFAAGGATGNGALVEVATAGGSAYCIGVDSDQWESLPEVRPCLITSAMKLIAPGVVDIITGWNAGDPPFGNYIGDVGLADYHDFSSVIPADVQSQIADLTPQVLAGEVPTGSTP